MWGAGLAGIVAAVTAARAGLSTALINDRSVPGGNASSEIGVVIQGFAPRLKPVGLRKGNGDSGRDTTKAGLCGKFS